MYYNERCNIYVIKFKKREREESMRLKSIWRYDGWKFQKFGKRHEPTYLRIWWTLKIRLKKSTSVYIIIKLLKPKGKEKILKAARHKNDTLSIRRKQFNESGFLLRLKRSKRSGTTFSNAGRKELSTQNSITQWKCPSRITRISWHSQMKEN